MTAQRDSNRLVSTYSRGMRQRLGLALSLLAQPDLVVLDEPTNLLDPAGIHEMRDLIFGFPTEHGLTVFLSSHLLADVDQLASHVGIIGRGRLLFEGTLSELLSQQRAYVVVEVDQPSIARSVLLQAGWTIRRVGDGATASTLMVDLHERADVARAANVLVAAGLSLYELRRFAGTGGSVPRSDQRRKPLVLTERRRTRTNHSGSGLMIDCRPKRSICLS